MEENVAERLKAIVAKRLDVDASTIGPDSSFVEDLGADSLDLVDLSMSLEEEFSIRIQATDYVRLTCTSDAVAYVLERLSALPVVEPADPLCQPS
jgi:acyl carrier protein